MAIKKRTSKTSKGQRKSSRKVALTPLQKILMGGGILVKFEEDNDNAEKNRRVNRNKS